MPPRGEVEHRYGPQVHILDDAYLLTLLARIGSPSTGPRDLARLVRLFYEQMSAIVMGREFPTVEAVVETRMAATEPRGFYRGRVLDRRVQVVVVAVIRAGLLPAEVCFETFGEALDQEKVRLDFVNMARELDGHGHVVGAQLSGSKIGGPVDEACLVIPDPMGATGSTACRVLEHYRSHVQGKPRRIISVPMIATPEYLIRLKRDHPEVVVYTARLDRGLSPEDVLAEVPGTHPELERGLNDKHYIVPGAGGMGEVMTNSFC